MDSTEDQEEMTPAGVNVRGKSFIVSVSHRYVAVCARQTGSAMIRCYWPLTVARVQTTSENFSLIQIKSLVLNIIP